MENENKEKLNETALVRRVEMEPVTREMLVKYLDFIGVSNQLTTNEKGNFIEIAMAFQLNPFKREIYCIPYGSGENRKTSIITGYEVYLKRAERIGKLDGWSVSFAGAIKPFKTTQRLKKKDGGYWDKDVTSWQGDLSATITIHRKDWSKPFVHTVFFNEFNRKNEIWNTMPYSQLKKVVTGQGFRICFPEDCGGMPYTADELPPEMTGENARDITPPEPENTAAPAHSPSPAQEKKPAGKKEQTLSEKFAAAKGAISKAKTESELKKLLAAIESRGFDEGQINTLTTLYQKRVAELLPPANDENEPSFEPDDFPEPGSNG